jgi:hypothetical protein
MKLKQKSRRKSKLPLVFVQRRTFEAVEQPSGSSLRARLNTGALTSEYLPEYPYAMANGRGSLCFLSEEDALVTAELENTLRGLL